MKVYCGFDQREALAYHVFCQSVIDHASEPVSFAPLSLTVLQGFQNHKGGTNNFITSRYLIPCLEDFRGWALFCDGDMVVRDDIARLWALRDDRFAVMVVPHEYKTQHPRKYKGSPLEADNKDYPRKNWSSVMLINCGHPANRVLTLDYVNRAESQHLHRFDWLMPHEIGTLPGEWNRLQGEEALGNNPKLVHYTLGVPGFEYYADEDIPNGWHRAFLRALNIEGENPVDLVNRAMLRA